MGTTYLSPYNKFQKEVSRLKEENETLNYFHIYKKV